MRVINFCILLISLVLISCVQNTAPNSSLPIFSETPPVTIASTSTPILNYKTIILTPDDLFSLPNLNELSTPNSYESCEHLPLPQIVSNPNSFSILSGKFALCIYEYTNIAMDLDTGVLVSADDPRGDIVMFNGRFGTSEKPDYGLSGQNNAYLEDALVLENYANHSGVNNLSSEYCENMVQGMTDTRVINVEEGAIACIRTTEGRVALIRVEKIYPANTLSAEFSFTLLETLIATPVITSTPTLTPGPSPTATNTPTDQELLDAFDERVQDFFHMPGSNLIDFLLVIQESLRTENKEKLASLVYYPITIYRFEGNNHKEIQNKEEFIANYEKIVTPEWKDSILSQEPAKLFMNWQGVMVSRGELWFSPLCLDQSCKETKLYIITINHTD
jgi:hypothetical protein